MLKSKRPERFQAITAASRGCFPAHSAFPIRAGRERIKPMQITNMIANLTRSLTGGSQSADSLRSTYCFPANGTAGYTSSIWVRDYGSGLCMRVPF